MLSLGVRTPQATARASDTGPAGPGSPGESVWARSGPPVAGHATMNWAQRLKRVFNIDIETCRVCGGTL
jgi:hypothetical protein